MNNVYRNLKYFEKNTYTIKTFNLLNKNSIFEKIIPYIKKNNVLKEFNILKTKRIY